MKKRNKVTVITERDRNLIHYLYENKVATQKQIRRDILKIAQQNVSRRLVKLSREKLIVGNYLKDQSDSTKIYSITSKAFNRYLKDLFDDIMQEQFLSSCPNHDLELVNIRNSLKKREDIKKYTTENILQSSDDFYLIKHNPDAVLEVNVQGDMFTFCLEYEASMKATSRYENLLRKYYFDKKIEAVFFIYKERKIFEKVVSLEKTIFSHRTPRFFHCSLEEVLSNEHKITFINFENSKISLT